MKSAIALFGTRTVNNHKELFSFNINRSFFFFFIYIFGTILGSRHLTGTRDETFDDDLDCLYDGYSRGCNPEDDIEDEFVSIQRRFKQRAADAFEEDLAELRRKRRDLQVSFFILLFFSFIFRYLSNFLFSF